MSFSHRVRPGVNRVSHGLDIARLAAMPHDTIRIAEHMHTWLVQHGQAHLQTKGLLQDILKSKP